MHQLENTALAKLTSKRILLGLCVLAAGLFLNLPENANAAPAKAQARAAKSAAKDGGRISKIDVSGNVKIEKDAVTERLKSKVGSAYSAETIREDIQELFDSGFFYNVEVFRNDVGGDVELTYKLTEKPSIAEVVFEGNSEIKTEELQEAAGIKAYEILNMSKLRDAVEKLQKMYEDKGFFLAKVEYKIDDIKPNEQVKVSFKISENDKVKVKKITFIGNNKMQSGQLLSRMQTQEGGYFSFISGSGAYKQDVFDRDVIGLRFLYFNDGYVQVKIDRPQVYVTPDKKGIYITIRIDEGEQFNVGDIDFSGDLLFPRDELFETIGIDEKKVFAWEQMQKDLSDLQAKYGDLGYAFANVIPRTRINEEERKVDVTFEFDKGNKVYFGQINVVGNGKTRDKVVRRELKVREGELYNETRRRDSLANIQRLGFFEEVNFKTNTHPDHPTILNIDIVVKERNTGTIQLGAGYGTQTGATFQGQVSQTNFRGLGQKLSATANVSQDNSLYSLNFTEPHVFDSEWSSGFDLYQSKSDRDQYIEQKKGGAVRLGHPLGEYLDGFLRYKLDETSLRSKHGEGHVRLADPVLFPFDKGEGITSSLTGTLEYDTRNDRFSPSKGIFASTSLEYAGLGGDFEYTKSSASFRFYKKVFWEVVWRNNLTGGVISAPDGKPVPFNETYLLGGPYNLRGYRWTQVGLRKFSNQEYERLKKLNVSEHKAEKQAWLPYGGTHQLYFTTEFEFPLITEAGIKGVVFYDIGQAENSISADNFFADVGFGFRWFSPIGPLRFEWGFPLNRNSAYHQPTVFEFAIGSPF